MEYRLDDLKNAKTIKRKNKRNRDNFEKLTSVNKSENPEKLLGSTNRSSKQGTFFFKKFTVYFILICCLNRLITKILIFPLFSNNKCIFKFFRL